MSKISLTSSEEKRRRDISIVVVMTLLSLLDDLRVITYKASYGRWDDFASRHEV